MGSRETHCELARHDEGLVAHLDPPSTQFLDWVIAATYWAALHYIDAVLALEEVHPKRDRERINPIANHSRFKALYRNYRELKTYYENAIGVGRKYTPQDYELAIAPHLRTIRGAALRFLDLWDRYHEKK